MTQRKSRTSTPQYADFSELPLLKQSLWFSFIKAYKNVVERVDRDLRKQDLLSLSEYELVAMVNSCGGKVRFIDLAKITLLSQSRVSRLVDTLQKKGLLRRNATGVNRRATYAEITPKGKKELQETTMILVETLDENFFGRMPNSKHEQFQGLLEVLLEPDERKQSLEIIRSVRESNGLPPGPFDSD